jgi:hypothetical protein
MLSHIFEDIIFFSTSVRDAPNINYLYTLI